MRAILIDDEPDNLKLLAIQLARHCPQVEVAGQYTESTEGLKAIHNLQPSLVFLDIEMPVMNGFQLLEKVGDINFQLVFITAYDQYAVRAFRFSALDYLLKPVDTIDLVAAVQRAEKLNRIHPQQLDLLQQYYASGAMNTPQKIALPHATGLVFVDIGRIIYCEADSNYTRFYLEDGEQYMISKNLGNVQEVLETRNFVRVHRKFMVNIQHIRKLIKGEGIYLLLTNGTSVPVARQQKDRLMERFGWI
ncbi:LytR/AlgR family response regulator transcription factor [Catalinimonas niigatensis]|uniref:LytR/AlgR family response regulator transcription factor n=1 Tax=Catalinimonas niigatensis TaxID=1397264 RepID=UPI002665A5C8|nr:LytTR family DNA-binding domain-containing protein [Catalinimonas niigatensis]WPP51968.1 LytTR family DNA-binding domain-containing protein [Catalinimonas niigatensis]